MGHEILQSLLLLRGAKMSEKFHKNEKKATNLETCKNGLISLIWKRKRRLLANYNNHSALKELPLEKPPKLAFLNYRSLSYDTNSFHSFPSSILTNSNGTIAELVATERDYITHLDICHRIYIKAFRQMNTMLGCTEVELFGNLSSIRRFHRNILLPRLLIVQSNPFFTIHLFLQLAPFIRSIYLPFLESRAKFGRLIQSQPIQKWANGICTKFKLSPAQSLDSLLIRPIQRLFQLTALLERIECPKGDLLANAVRNQALLEMHRIPRLANDRLHLRRIFPSKSIRFASLAQLGDLHFSNVFRLKANKKAAKLLMGKRRKRQRKIRHCRVFLFGRGLLLAKQKMGTSGIEKERLKPIGCIPLCRLIRLSWEGGPEFCLFLRCSFSQSSRRRQLGKIHFRAEKEAIAMDWIRRLRVQQLPIVQQNSPNNLPPPKLSPHSSSLADSSYFSRSSSSDVEHLALSRECSGGSNASSSFSFNGTKESLDEEEFCQKMKICEGGDSRMEIDPKIMEFAIRLGFNEEKLRTVLLNLEEGENIEQDRILSELVKLDGQNTAKTMERRMGEWPKLRPIVLDGSNIAMTHGNKMVFSCEGIRQCVNFFEVRGHSDILVFVPQFRREQSRQDAPIVDQHILMELEAKRQLIWTPSRRIGNRRIVCHDDRYILKTAAEKQAIIVSNDEYRDLVKENAEWKTVVDNFLLMYTFVDGKFMPPDDPLGRRGLNLEQFLTFSKIPMNSQPCPYAKKCTYGNKCKYFHPERPNGIRMGAADRLIAGMELASTKVHSTLGQQNHSNIGRTKSLNLPPKISPSPQQHSPILRIESSPVHYPSIDHFQQHMFKSSPIWGDCEFPLMSPNQSISSLSSHQQNDRLRLQYHLSQLFPESVVLAVMAAHPNEMNGQRLCQRIIAFQNEYGRIPMNE